MMLLTNRKQVMGPRRNGRFTNVLGWAATAITFAATLCLVASWL